MDVRGRSETAAIVQNILKNRKIYAARRSLAFTGVRSQPVRLLVDLVVSPAYNNTDTNMPLSDLEVKAAKPGQGVIKLSDGGGLQLWVTSDGAKRWRLAYRFGGVQKVLALGVYKKGG